MRFVICAQDISSVTFALFSQDRVVHEQTIETQPEGYLFTLDQVLWEWNVAPQELKEIVVVTGPGSFTASRVSTTIANGFAFAQSLRIIGVENPLQLSVQELLSTSPQTATSYAVPSYDHPPEITQSK